MTHSSCRTPRDGCAFAALARPASETDGERIPWVDDPKDEASIWGSQDGIHAQDGASHEEENGDGRTSEGRVS